MNRAKLAMLASTSLCLSIGPSYAADMALKARVAPVVADPWVGFYAGGNLGYSWGKSDTAISVLPFGTSNLAGFGTFAFPGAANSTSSNVNGLVGGGQFGFVGRIAPHWLGGIEADIQWSGERGSAHGLSSGISPECTSGDCSFTSARDITAKLNWFGTFRGRAGFESNGFWIYGTGGLAFGEVSVSGNNTLVLIDNTGQGVVGSYSTPFKYSQLKAGWTAGLGIEGIIGNGPWRWKVEYLHIDLGSINGGLFGGPYVLPPTILTNSRFTDEILRAGFNYKFDWGKSVVADMPLKARAPSSLAASWTGWYAGVNLGYIDSVGRTNTDAPFSVTDSRGIGDAGNLADTATNQFNHNIQGLLGGAQAGYNFQFSPSFVAGWEADIQGSTLRHNVSATSTATEPFYPAWTTTTTVSDRLDYLGTVRGRIGVIPTPNLMLYSTGGLAFGRVHSSTQIGFDNTAFGAPPGATSGSLSEFRFGWTAGGGLEWMLSGNWTAKLEYLYYDLGSASYATGGYAVDLGPTNFSGFGVASLATSTTTRFNGSIARVGLNYKFAGGR